MQARELRRTFLDFFAERGHKVLPSSSLVPNDSSLLFTAAGMVPFKDVFWGHVEPPFRRAATCQKCFRTTDIENVGRTSFHHTFFEMLGNFSFGDYFKREAIELAWRFVTDELGVSSDRLWASVYEEDDDAATIWQDVIGLPSERIVRLGKGENWWGPVGGSGPCGPDSELFVDTGAENACGPDCRGVACECDRYSEIWNLVFMEYDAQQDGTFVPLPRRNIDTGMGLERTAAVLQGVQSDFDIDLLRPIIEAIEGAMPRKLGDDDLRFRNTIADHVRGVLFLLADGVTPGNEKQGYVLRRVLRRAIRAGEKLELPVGSMARFADPVIETLGDVYPEIVEVGDSARRILTREEEAFRRTLRDGERRLDKILGELAEAGEAILPGQLAFELYDTYGFPLEMTKEIASDAGVRIEEGKFAEALDEQRARSRMAVGVSVSAEAELVPAGSAPTRFLGHDTTEAESTVENVLGTEGQMRRIVFAESPFYAEAGGQVGDRGRIENLTRLGTANVIDSRSNAKGVFLHSVEISEGAFAVGDRCKLVVDEPRRRRIERNHTATHLLHAALREVLGPHAKQAGSEVDDRELRFDFSHFDQMSPEELRRVEDLANAAVLADHPVSAEELPLDEAKATGAIGLFEDAYRGRELVRVVRVGDVSSELCGGTHVRRSGEIGLIKIVSEESIASGVRRIRAITGDAVLAYLRDQGAFAERMKKALGDDPEQGLNRLTAENAGLQAQVREARGDQVKAMGERLLVESAVEVEGIRLVSGRVDVPADQIVALADLLEARARPSVVVLVGDAGGRGIALCKASKEAGGVDARTVLGEMTRVLGGGGGGGRSFAQGGGANVDKLDEALAAGETAARSALS
jgi:alanyl-tRNA synthetase